MTRLYRCSKVILIGVTAFSALIIIRNLTNQLTLKHWYGVARAEENRPGKIRSEKENNITSPAESDNIKRLQTLRQACRQQSDKRTELNYLKHLIVNEKYKMVFCYIPKISCSQWKTLFITLTGKVNASLLNFGNVHTRYRSKMTYLGEYSIEKRHSILQKYKKYIVVRNPFERLLSAFRNKFANKVNYYELIAKKIIKQYRSNATKESDDVTFFEFVQYITDGKTRYYDPHWNRYTTLCRPCFVKYDFVGKYETIARDAEFILRDFGAPPEIKFPKRSEKYQSVETIKTFKKYYSQIPAEYIAKLWNIYRLDFEAFGYSVSDTFKISPNV